MRDEDTAPRSIQPHTHPLTGGNDARRRHGPALNTTAHPPTHSREGCETKTRPRAQHNRTPTPTQAGRMAIGRHRPVLNTTAHPPTHSRRKTRPRAQYNRTPTHTTGRMREVDTAPGSIQPHTHSHKAGKDARGRHGPALREVDTAPRSIQPHTHSHKAGKDARGRHGPALNTAAHPPTHRRKGCERKTPPCAR